MIHISTNHGEHYAVGTASNRTYVLMDVTGGPGKIRLLLTDTEVEQLINLLLQHREKLVDAADNPVVVDTSNIKVSP